MLGTSKLDMGRAVFAMRLPRVPCQSAWRSKQEPLLAGDDMLRIVELSVTCTAHLGGLAAACRGCALLAPAGSGTSSSNSMVQVIAGTWRLLLTAPYKLAVKLVACKQGCVAYLCQPGESCATPAFRRPSPCSAVAASAQPPKCTKPCPRGSELCPLHQQYAAVYKTPKFWSSLQPTAGTQFTTDNLGRAAAGCTAATESGGPF